MTPASLASSPAAINSQGDHQTEGMMSALLAATLGTTGKGTVPAKGFEGLFPSSATGEDVGIDVDQTLKSSKSAATQTVVSMFVPMMAEANPLADVPVTEVTTDAVQEAAEGMMSSLAASSTPANAATTNSSASSPGSATTTKVATLAATGLPQPGSVATPDTSASAQNVSANPAAGATPTPDMKSAESPTVGSTVNPTVQDNKNVLQSSSDQRASLTTETGSEQAASAPGLTSQRPLGTPASTPATTASRQDVSPETQSIIPSTSETPTGKASGTTTLEPASINLPKEASVATSAAMAQATTNPTAARSATTPPTPATAMEATLSSDAPVQPDTAPKNKAQSTRSNPAANFTQQAPSKSSAAQTSADNPENTFTNKQESTTNKLSESLGTDIAKESLTMSAATSQRRSSLAENRETSVSTGLASESALKETTIALPRDPVPAASHVLGTVLKIINQPDKPERSHVDLQFDFGRDTLAVRVGMKGGEVQTIFQTSSAELRTALTQQWQDFAGHLPDTARTLAEPVFTNHGSSMTSWSQHDGSSARQQADSSEEQFAMSPTSVDDEPESLETPILHRPVSSTSGQQRLNTLA